MCSATCVEKHQARDDNTQKQSHPMLQPFSRLCDMYLLPSGWIPYQINDDLFQLKGIVAHVGKMECDAMMTMQVIGVNAIEVYIA